MYPPSQPGSQPDDAPDGTPTDPRDPGSLQDEPVPTIVDPDYSPTLPDPPTGTVATHPYNLRDFTVVVDLTNFTGDTIHQIYWYVVKIEPALATSGTRTYLALTSCPTTAGKPCGSMVLPPDSLFAEGGAPANPFPALSGQRTIHEWEFKPGCQGLYAVYLQSSITGETGTTVYQGIAIMTPQDGDDAGAESDTDQG